MPLDWHSSRASSTASSAMRTVAKGYRAHAFRGLVKAFNDERTLPPCALSSPAADEVREQDTD